jgi:hypothetical protein
MKFLGFVIALAMCSCSSQYYIRLKKGWSKFTIAPGQRLMPVMKSDTASYSAWKYSDKFPASLPKDSVWEVSEVKSDGHITLAKYTSNIYAKVRESEYLRIKDTERDTFMTWRHDSSLVHPVKDSTILYLSKGVITYSTINIFDVRSVRMAKASSDFPRLGSYIAITAFALVTGFGAYTTAFTENSGSIGNIVMAGGAIGLALNLAVLPTYKVRTYHLNDWKITVKKR